MVKSYLGNTLHLIGERPTTSAPVAAALPAVPQHPQLPSSLLDLKHKFKRGCTTLDVTSNMDAEGVTDATLVAFALRRVRASATFLVCAEALQRKFLRLVCRIMGRGEAATRIQAFLLLRQMATCLPDPMPSNALKVGARWWPGAAVGLKPASSRVEAA